MIFWLETLFPLFHRQFDGLGQRGKHAAKNIALGILNGAVGALFFSSLTVGVIGWSSGHEFGILRILGVHGIWAGIIGFVLFDLWMYIWHVANHLVPFLWRFHRVHHSDAAMDTTTALRFHVGEIIFSSILRLGIVVLLGLDFAQLVVYELCLQPVILFHHSNVALPERWDRMFRAIIVTPNMHRVHHSQAPQENNSNYASIFSCWDRLGGSFRLREDAKTIVYGLEEFSSAAWQGLARTLFLPLMPVRPRRTK